MLRATQIDKEYYHLNDTVFGDCFQSDFFDSLAI